MSSGDWMLLGVTVFGFVGAVSGWIVRYFNARIDQERAERELVAANLRNFELRVANDYPSYQRLRDLLGPISSGIEELKGDMRGLFDRLDKKADK